MNVRVIAATNRDLEAEIARGRFRADLYHRLAVFPLRVPPLRDRADDIPHLAAHFADEWARRLGLTRVRISAAAKALLQAADWPGNVRELENVVSRAVLRAAGASRPPDGVVTIEPTHVDVVGTTAAPPVAPVPDAAAAPGAPLRDQLEAFERQAILDAVARHEGNWAAAARSLGMHRSNLHHRATRLGLRDA